MRCLFCRGKIGVPRKWLDQHYCSKEHRRRALLGEELEESWLASSSRREELAKRNPGTSAATGLLLVVAVVFTILCLPSPKSVGQRTPGLAPKTSPSSVSAFEEKLRSWMPRSTTVRLSEDFSSGLGSWVGQGGAGWQRKGNAVRPGKLRLWKESLPLKDYQLEFFAQIEKSSVGWVFRAVDLENYYAAKISITRPGPLPRAEIIRFTVLGGRQGPRVALPLPFTVRHDTLYRVKVSVNGDHFVTYVNGQVVDSWTDDRLKSGGVGFFSEAGEAASLLSVSLSAGQGIFDRLFSSWRVAEDFDAPGWALEPRSYPRPAFFRGA